MDLSQVITKAKSVADLNEVFAHNVNVKLGWLNDIVTVEGYEGAVSTDFIARRVVSVRRGLEITEDSKQLAKFLAEKVFAPLTNLVESPENCCSLYQLTALTRMTYTPPQEPEFGCSIALKHAMILGLLDQKYTTMW